jgi:hypothetical protein
MIRSADAAAAALLQKIKAPPGAVNTMASRDASGACIRVLVDPIYWFSVSCLPTTFNGYRVVVERREPSQALH